MRIQKGESTAGLDSLKLRQYFRKYAVRQFDSASLAEALLLSRKNAENLIEKLVRLGLIRRAEVQADKKSRLL